VTGCITQEVLRHREIDFPAQESRNRYTYITLCDTQAALRIHPRERDQKMPLTNLHFSRLRLITDSPIVEGTCIESQMIPRNIQNVITIIQL
jgi:hypothetical protein